MTELNELNLETAVPANLDEWLRGFFDGGRHHVGGRPNVLFPRADISFGHGKPATPLAGNDDAAPGVEIRCVTLNVVKNGASQHAYDAPDWSGKLAEDVVLFQFQVRAKRSGAGEAQLLTAQVGQLLHAILNNPITREPIARAGITHLQARKPEILPQPDYALRLVYCTARLSYPIWLLSPADNPVLHDADGNLYTLRVVTSAEGVPQLELAAPVPPADNLVLVDETGAAYRLNIATDGGAPQLEPTPTDAPGVQSLTLRDPDGHPYTVRVTRAAGTPQLDIASA